MASFIMIKMMINPVEFRLRHFCSSDGLDLLMPSAAKWAAIYIHFRILKTFHKEKEMKGKNISQSQSTQSTLSEAHQFLFTITVSLYSMIEWK